MTKKVQPLIDRFFLTVLALFVVALAGMFGYASFLLAFAAEGNKLWITLASQAVLAGAISSLFLTVKLVFQKPVPPP